MIFLYTMECLFSGTEYGEILMAKHEALNVFIYLCNHRYIYVHVWFPSFHCVAIYLEYEFVYFHMFCKWILYFSSLKCNLWIPTCHVSSWDCY